MAVHNPPFLAPEIHTTMPAGEVFAPLPDIFLGTALEAHIMFLGMSLEYV